MVELCEKSRLRWWVVPWVYRSAPTGLRVDTVGLIPLVGRRGSNIEGLNYLVKRIFDVVCASLILIVAMPDDRARRSRDFNFRRPARSSSASSESARRAVDLKC